MSAFRPVPRAEYLRLRRAVSVTAVFLIAVVTQGAEYLSDGMNVLTAAPQ